MRLFITGLALSLIPLASEAGAQTAAPAAGTWGAEATLSGSGTAGTILRMRSDRSALALGFGLDHLEQGNARLTSVGIRAGLRRYAAAGRAIRPYHTLGVVVNSTTGITDALEAGVFGDIGAAYFFNQHVSIAAAGDSRVTFGRVGSAPNDQSIVRFSILGPRILATLYF